MTTLPKIVTLNVGGEFITTSLYTLIRYPESMLGRMFSGDYALNCDAEGRYFIDANGKMFQHILDFLRRNKLVLPHGFNECDLLLAEAEYFQILPMMEILSKKTECDVITMNVGGAIYATSSKTISKYPTSRLYRMLNEEIRPVYDKDGNFFFDSDGDMFKHILNYMRRDELLLPKDFDEFDLLLLEAEYHQIETLIRSLRNTNYRLDLISIKVGDKIYHTTNKTLQKHPQTNLRRLLRVMDENGRYNIENVDQNLFPYILDYLRKDELCLPPDFKDEEKLLEQARLFDIDPLISEAKKMISSKRKRSTNINDDRESTTEDEDGVVEHQGEGVEGEDIPL